MNHCAKESFSEHCNGSYKVKIHAPRAKEYDDDRLYKAMLEPEVWRKLSEQNFQDFNPY